jgi:hypothetical protein
MALSTPNIVIYSAQILVLISAAAIGAVIFRLPLARARLAYWRVVVVTCLALPWVSALVNLPPPFVSSHALSGIALGTSPETVAGSSLSAQFVPLLVLLGAGARGAWLAVGLLRLRHLREHSTTASRSRSPLASVVRSSCSRDDCSTCRSTPSTRCCAMNCCMSRGATGCGWPSNRLCRRHSGFTRRCGGRSGRCI